MKEATGELNMTVVTLIAIAAIGGLFYIAIWPMVQRMLVQQTCNTYGQNYQAVKAEKSSLNSDAKSGSSNSQAEVFEWACCPKEKQVTKFAAGQIPDGCIGAK